MDYTRLPEYMGEQYWRRYRLEYGFECKCPEGTIYLPPWVDIWEVTNFINDRIKDGPAKSPKSDQEVAP
jgi:hypothetical protein